MADFYFNPNNTNEQDEQKPQIGFTTPKREAIGEQSKQQVAERQANRDMYGIDLPDEVYKVLNENAISKSENPEEEAHKWACAFKYSQAYGIDLRDAYENVDNFNKALWDDKPQQSYKNWFKSITDMIVLGNNNVKLGTLGNDLRNAELAGDEEAAKLIWNEINAIDADNETRLDNTPRNWITKTIQTGAQSLPFTGYTAAAGLFGNFIGAGPAMTFAVSSGLTAGQEYIDMRQKESTPKTAALMSTISGGIQGLVEAELGISKGMTKAGAKLIGKEVKDSLSDIAVDKVKTELAKRLHFSALPKMLLNMGVDYADNLIGEGKEEFIQEITSEVGQNIAATLDGLDIPYEKKSEILKNSVEAFKGGVQGAIFLGIFPASLNTVATARDYKKVADFARTTESEEMLNRYMNNTPEGQAVKNSYTEEQQETLVHDIFTNFDNQRTRENNIKIKEIAEVNPANEGFEEAEYDEETGEVIAAEPYRKENGELDTQNIKTGENTYSFRVGDTTKENKNLYGNIEYTVNNENKTVEIQAFQLPHHREGIREEFYDQFAKKYAGYNIKWDTTIGSLARAHKEALINSNPSGKKNGLNYYEDEYAIKNAAARKDYANRIKNVYSKARRQLSDDELTGILAISEGWNNSLNEATRAQFKEAGINDFADLLERVDLRNDDQLKKYFTEADGTVRQEYETTQGLTIPTSLKEIAKGAKAIIYVGKNADMSTMIHEFSHVMRNLVSDEQLQEIGTALKLNKDENGNFIWDRDAEEALAYNAEKYLYGKYTPESNALKDFFDSLAKFMYSTIHHLKRTMDFNPEIIKAYDDLFNVDNSVLNNARTAVDEMENGRRAKYYSDLQREQFNQKKQQAQEEKLKANKSSETTTTAEDQAIKDDFPLNEAEKAEAAETVKQEEKIVKDVKSNLATSTMSDKAQEAISNVITNPNVSLQDKKNIADAVAEDARKEDEGLFQLISLDSVKEAARNGYKNELMADARKYEFMNAKNSTFRNYHKNNTEEQIQELLKRDTGFETVNGVISYETEDGFNHLIGTKKFEALMNITPNQLALYSNSHDMRMEDYVAADELYKIFPVLKDARLQFYIDSTISAPVGKVTGEGISINLAVVDNSKGVKAESGIMGQIARQLQNLIFAIENSNTEELRGLDYKSIYEALYNKASDLDITSSYNEFVTNQIARLSENKLQQLSMQAAKRLMKSTNEKRNSRFETTDDVKNYLEDRTYGRRALAQVLGEMGATALDAAEESTVRMDNNQIAREMEKAGKDPKTIRLATGWEKGVEGLWRYETNDGLDRFDLVYKSLGYEKENPRYKELIDKLNKSYEGGESLTEEEVQELDTLADEVNSYYQKTEVKLNDILDAPELYKAYPELKNLPVEYKNEPLSNNTKGYYTKAYDLWSDAVVGEKIVINHAVNSYNEEEYKKVLLHEIQHWIQDKEGFASGGTGETAQSYLIDKIRNKLAKNINGDNEFSRSTRNAALINYLLLSRKLSDNPEYFIKTGYYQEYGSFFGLPKNKEDRINALEEIIDKWRTDMSEALETKSSNFWDQINYNSDEELKTLLKKEIRNKNKYADNHYNTLLDQEEMETIKNTDPLKLYLRLAGEVEARNVETRINFSDIERLNTLLSETADIAPEDQIVMHEAVTMANYEKNDIFDSTQINDNELKEVIKNIKHSQTRQEYIKKYYTELKNDYEIKTFTNSEGNITGNIEIYKNRKYEQKEIDDALFFVNKGYEVTLLVEGIDNDISFEDALLDHAVLVEFKNVESTNPKTIANNVKNAANKNNSEVITIYFMNKAKEVSYEDVIYQVANKINNGDIRGDFDELFFIKDNIITRLNKNTAGVNKLTAHRTSNINPDEINVNKKVLHQDLDSNLTEEQQEQVNTQNFKNWFEDSKAVDENGDPLVVHHGTTAGEFDVFDKSKGNVEGDWGSGFYFTNSDYDVEDNYAGGGPDFDNKVDRLAEQLENEEEYADLDYEERQKIARDKLFVGENTIDSFLRINNPCYVGDNETDIVEAINDNIDISEEDYDNEDDYYEALNEAQDQVIQEVYDAIDNLGYDDVDEAKDVFSEFISNGSGTAQELKDLLNERVYAYDENGDLATNEVARAIIEALGYDGIIDSSVSSKFSGMNLSDDTTHYIVFSPNQIKDAYNNNGDFSNDNPSILYQSLDDDQTLYGVHNISEEGLKHAFEMGGLANPSMAVVDKNVQSLEGFGEISLIALSSTINKSTGGNAGTFGGDIYSPRYPNITTFVTDEGQKNVADIFSKVAEKYPEYASKLESSLINKMESSSRLGGESLVYSTLPIAYFADKGRMDEVVQNYKGYFDKDIDDKVKEIGYRDKVDVISALKEGNKDKAVELSNLFIKVEEESNKDKNFDDRIKAELRKHWLQEGFTDVINFNLLDDFLYKAWKDIESEGKIDEYQAENNARHLLLDNEELKADFIKWAEDKYAGIEREEKIFNGFTPSGNRRYLSHTLENVSKFMKQQGLKGGENFSYGMNSTKALLAPKWTTLAQIRKNKGRLATAEQVEAAREELTDQYDELIEKLGADIGDTDAGEARLQEAYSTPGVDPLTYLEDEYGIEFTEDEAADFRIFTDALRNLPTKYFETKWEKPIYTENFGNTFAAAVVPKNIDPSLKEKLEKNYLYVFEYDPSEDGAKAAVTKQALDAVSTKRKVLFQTQDELYNDARKFDTWQEFMDDYTMSFDPMSFEDPEYHSQVPSDADAQFYQSVWEMAHAMQTEESMNEEEAKRQAETDTSEAAALDAFFITKVTNDPDFLDDFLKKAAEISEIDFGSEDYTNPADEEEELQWQKWEAQQDYIKTQLSHGSWISNGQRLLNGKEITDSQRSRIISLIKAAPRDYRAIYAEIMDAPYLKVEYKDSIAAKLEKNARKYKLVNPNEDIERMSPEKRRQLAEQINDRQMKEKIRNGSLKLDDEVTAYIKSLEKKVKAGKKEVEDLEAAQAADYKTIADWETRRLLELNGKLIEARAAYNKANDKVTRDIAKGIKISGKYQKQVQNMKADYDEIFRKFEDLRNVITINAKVQEMLDRQEKIKKAKGSLGKIEDEAKTMREVKDLRIQLVKRTMRRVPFDRIAYDEAKKIIATQLLLQPNLVGGVNRWISTEGAVLRNVISGILTDSDYKKQIMAYVKANAKSSEASVNFIQKLESLKSIEDYEKWDDKTKKYAIKHLPKENWVRELKLEELAKEREESIDLDIELKEVQEPMKDENGEFIYKPFYEADGETIVKNPMDPSRQLVDENGNPIKDESGAVMYKKVYNKAGQEVDPSVKEIYMLTKFEVTPSDEVKNLVKDAVGADLYDAILNRPFSDWSTEDLEKLAIKINNLYTEGRDKLAATKQLRREGQRELRDAIENAVKNTGIVINPDDPDDVKKKKQEKINKILGMDPNLKGTKNTKKESKINRFLHGYADANVRRVARILDNYSEGTNTDLLYWREDECYNNKARSIRSRVEKINGVMNDFNLSLNDLYKEVEVDGRKFTVDELLFFLAADEDYEEDEAKLEKGLEGLDANDDYAPTSRNAVMFGNMLSDRESLELKEKLTQEDKDMAERLQSGELTTDERNALILGELIKHPGTNDYIEKCKNRYERVLAAAYKVEAENPGFKALRAVIAEDYAKQYGRMNETSILEFNTPVHRVKCYVPMYRLESNGDTNENQVKADLLATMGADSARSWVNKGMTQRRVNVSPLNQKPIQTGLYKTWTDSTEKTEHFIAYSGYVRDLNAVYKSRDANFVRQYLESRYGKGMVNYIDEYISEVANPNANKVRTAADEIIRTLRGKTAPAYLSWKASSILKQAATSPWPYMQFVNPVSYVASCFKCMRPGTMDAIKSKSVFMANRRFDPMADLTDEMADKARNKFDSVMAKTSQIGMSGLEMIDWVAVAPGWLACYEKKYNELNNNNNERYQAIKRQLEEDRAFNADNYKSNEEIEKLADQTLKDAIEYEAVRYADDCVRLCQPSNRSVDISPLFKNSSEAWKAYLQFQTSLNVIWQNIRYDLPYAVRQKQFQQVAGMILGYTFAGVAMNFLIDGAGNDAGDDDDKKKEQVIRDLIYYSTTQFSDSIPLIGSAVTAADKAMITGKAGYTTSGTDMTPMLTKFIQVGENAVKGMTYDDEEKAKKAWIKACTNFGEGVGMYLGLPTQGVKEALKIAGVGDNDGKAGVHLENVYGSLDPVAKKVYGD